MELLPKPPKLKPPRPPWLLIFSFITISGSAKACQRGILTVLLPSPPHCCTATLLCGSNPTVTPATTKPIKLPTTQEAVYTAEPDTLDHLQPGTKVPLPAYFPVCLWSFLGWGLHPSRRDSFRYAPLPPGMLLPASTWSNPPTTSLLSLPSQ